MKGQNHLNIQDEEPIHALPGGLFLSKRSATSRAASGDFMPFASRTCASFRLAVWI